MDGFTISRKDFKTESEWNDFKKAVYKFLQDCEGDFDVDSVEDDIVIIFYYGI